MSQKTKRISTLLGSALVSGTALAAPKPFDTDLALELANNPAYALPTDEEAVMHSIVRCGPGQRICEEKPLDLNGDGNVDLVVGVNQDEGGAHKRVYLGRSDGLFNPALLRGLVTTTSGLKFADLDGDGDLDMVETVRGNGTVGQNVVYVNREGTLESLFNDEQTLDYPLATKHDRSSSVAIGDVNGDGKLDIVIGNETAGSHDVSSPPKTNYLYINETTAPNTGVKFRKAIELDAPGTEAYTRRVLLVDVDNDDDLDLVATSADTSADGAGNGNVLYVNTGASPNPFAAAVPLNTDTSDDTDVANAIAAGDLNNDGKIDLVFSTWSRTGALDGASDRYYINSSNGSTIDFTAGTFGPNARSTNVRLGDFDNDGDLDAVIASFGSKSRLHLNNAGVLSATGFELDVPAGVAADRPRSIEAADINGDGSLDLLIVNRNQLGLRYLNNNQCRSGSCTATFAHPFQNYGPNITAQIATATTPPGGASIKMKQHLVALDVVDPDNVYPSDFEALPVPSAPEYTCTLGTNTGRFVGTCIGGEILPGASAGNDGFIRPIIIRVDDGQATSNRLNTFELRIGTGSAPTFTTTTLAPATEDAAYSTTLAATDLDGDSPLTYEPESPLPSWLQLSPAGALTSATGTTPQQGDVGVHTLKVRVRDPGGLSSIGTLSLTVTNVNDKPSVTTTTLPNGTQGQAYSATVAGADEDPGTTLTFAATGLPSGLSISNDGVITGTSTVAGTFPVDLTASDGTLTSDPVRVSLLVQAAAGTNANPVVAAIAAQTATVGSAFSLTVTATDADGDTPTFTAADLPAGLSMSAAGVISGTPTSTAGSPFTVTVTASDGKGGTGTGTFQLTVQAQGNRAPTFTAPGPQSGTVGTAFNLSLAGSATDADGDALTFAATGLPPGISISTAGLVSGSPTTATGSPFTVAVTVSDGKGGTTSGSFQFTVSNPTSGGGGDGGGGGSLGFLEVLALFGMGALAARRRRVAAGR